MRKQNLFVRISLCLTLLLLVAAVFIGCSDNKDRTDTTDTEYTFTLVAVFEDGSKETHEIKTNYKYVGAALEEQGLISGEMGEYGLTIHSVCGVDIGFGQKYWAVYTDGEYAMVGIDKIECSDVKKVELKVETY